MTIQEITVPMQKRKRNLLVCTNPNCLCAGSGARTTWHILNEDGTYSCESCGWIKRCNSQKMKKIDPKNL